MDTPSENINMALLFDLAPTIGQGIKNKASWYCFQQGYLNCSLTLQRGDTVCGYFFHKTSHCWVKVYSQHLYIISNSNTTLYLLSLKNLWRCRDLNPGPLTCEASALPLSYIPKLSSSSLLIPQAIFAD